MMSTLCCQRDGLLSDLRTLNTLSQYRYTRITGLASLYVTDVTDRACVCLKSVLRIGVDKDHRTTIWELILHDNGARTVYTYYTKWVA